MIINKSMKSSAYPSYWKTASVKPIPKKESIVQFNDLRPISILPVLSKILDKVVLNQILAYVLCN